MKIVRGLAFPDADEFMVGETKFDGTYQIDHLHAALRHITDFSCGADCGAHVGTWSRVMARQFARVIAVEPSLDTFEALRWNLEQAGCANVDAKNVALGDRPGTVEMTLTPEQAARANTGARYAHPGGSVPVEMIDAWHLPALGFLKLDVEGSEYAALRGARETLTRCKPIVLFENKFLWTRHFGLPKDAVAAFLRSIGYVFLEQVGSDQIWRPR